MPSLAVIFYVLELIDIHVDPNYALNTGNLVIANYNISIIGVVFATGMSIGSFPFSSGTYLDLNSLELKLSLPDHQSVDWPRCYVMVRV